MKEKRKLWITLVLTVLVSAGSVAVAFASESTPTLGLDLQGGFSVVLQARDVDGQPPSEESVEQAKDIIRQRVDGLGVAEPEIVRQGTTVIVALPGVTDREKAEEVVGCTAKLEFRPVLAITPNPDAVDAEATTDDTTAEDTTTTTAEGEGSTTTTAPAAEGEGDGEGETGMGAAGLGSGEGALSGQLAPTTTTTTAPPTTTTVPPATTSTVPESTTTTVPADAGTPATTAASGCAASNELSDEAIAAATPPPEGGVLAPSREGDLIYTLGPVGFTGESLSSADAILESEWAVSVDVKDSAREDANAAFNACFNNTPECPSTATGNGEGRGSIAIVLDGEVLSAPAVNGADLAASSFQITGQFSDEEAKDLALKLKYGALPVEFEQAALQQVSATLGTDSLRAGLIAGAVGIGLVALYMLLYYKGLGLVVVAGLTVWGGFMYALIVWLSANQGLALTLSGMIGIVVSVGTTVDSYVVYFERLKDEVRQGRSVRSSTERGFQSAIRTIITADVASFLGAFLLWYLTVGPVRGFAFFLGISVVLDLFVAYFFTRPLVALIGMSPRLTESGFLGLRSSKERAIEQAGAAPTAAPSAGAAS